MDYHVIAFEDCKMKFRVSLHFLFCFKHLNCHKTFCDEIYDTFIKFLQWQIKRRNDLLIHRYTTDVQTQINYNKQIII